MKITIKKRGVRIAGLVVLLCVAAALVYALGIGEAVQTQESTTMKLLTVRP